MSTQPPPRPQGSADGGASRDGLAALAILAITAALIVSLVLRVL